MDVLKELKVMYVEDDENTRTSIERFLKRRFGKVFMAENALKGIELFNKYSPDIAIVDILLPGMGGLEMIKKLRENNVECKFLITSTVNDAETILKAVDLDIENYIVKPIDTDAFEEKLRKIGNSIVKQRIRASAARGFSFENKNEIEESIRKLFIKILKEKSGRGPRDVVVFISNDAIEITAYGILGTAEKTLLKNIKNTAYVEQGRRLLYNSIEQELASNIEKVVGASVELQNVRVDAVRDREASVYVISEI